MVDPGTRYSEYWAYIRHAERLRFQVVGVLTAVGGAGVAVGRATDGIARREGLWVLVGYGLLVGFAGFYLLAHKASYDRYVLLMREHEPAVNRRRDRVLKDAFTWLLAMLTVLEGGVVVATCLTGAQGYVLLAAVAVVVAIVSFTVWWVAYWRIRRNHLDAWVSRISRRVDRTASQASEESGSAS